MRLTARVQGDSLSIVPLVGLISRANNAAISKHQIVWNVVAGEIEFETTLLLHPSKPTWFWRIRARNRGERSVSWEVFYGQDLGLAEEGMVRNNEAYTSQYIDHLPVHTSPLGWMVLSRQNQAQPEGLHPWIAQGCLNGAVAFSTDSYQFFGTSARSSGVPAAWGEKQLPSTRLQYESAYIGLQSQLQELSPGETSEVTFFACYQPDHPEASAASDTVEFAEFLSNAPTFAESMACSDVRVSSCDTLFSLAPILNGSPLEERDGHELFPGEWRHIEKCDGVLHSFFYGDHVHVITGAKEAIIERSHGHLLRSGENLWPDGDILGTTMFACGIFNAQTYYGNTNLGQFLSAVRDPLNLLRASGQRVFIRRGGQWQQLGIPSAFEMGMHHARWLYQIDGDLIEARTHCWQDRPAVSLELRTLHGSAREFLITHHLASGVDEWLPPNAFAIHSREGFCEYGPAEDSLLSRKSPHTRFVIVLGDPSVVVRLGGEEMLGNNGMLPHSHFAVVQTEPVENFTITLAAYDIARESASCMVKRIRRQLSQPFQVTAAQPLPLGQIHLSGACEDVARLDDILPWFAQNALIHFTAPHGLEQRYGAAWGVRDVCQGPVEWLLAARRFDEVRRILLTVFARQYHDTGDWPQWFMHAPFSEIQQRHSHGDILFWPVKALCDYIEASNDFTILLEELPYTDAASLTPTPVRETILKHLDRVLAQFSRRCIAGTRLVTYGDGDWDDTLQPADPSLRSTMVSSWTVGLAFHAFRLWKEICQRCGDDARAQQLEDLLVKIRFDFRRLLVVDGIVCGFAVFERNAIRPLLHPADTRTAIRYRLLPMTRAILAELFTLEEARHHAEIIRNELLFPDGVRLMSSPVPYHGGIETLFKRAETASCFGREISLQYVHAHLRYAEAMAKLGDAEAFWKALQVVNPIALNRVVPHAAPRQGNAYFSSSDGAFADRYEAGAAFAKLREGVVTVKGGWRIYSSGPGLYLHKVKCHLLGWRQSFDHLEIDPILPSALDGLTAKMNWDEKKLSVTYRVRPGAPARPKVWVNGVRLDSGSWMSNPYRLGGVKIPLFEWEQQLQKDRENEIKIDA